MKDKELTIETFGEIMDDFLKKNHIRVVIDIPEGTNDPEIRDNTGLGVAVWFYILLAAMAKVIGELEAKIIDPDKKEAFIDSCLAMVKSELMQRTEEGKK